jgi:hypothetical protein
MDGDAQRQRVAKKKEERLDEMRETAGRRDVFGRSSRASGKHAMVSIENVFKGRVREILLEWAKQELRQPVRRKPPVPD